MEELRPNFQKNKKVNSECLKLYNERLALYNDPDFDRKYYIPHEYFNNFLMNGDFDLEYFSIDNHKKRRLEKQDFMSDYIEKFNELENLEKISYEERITDGEIDNKYIYYKNKYILSHKDQKNIRNAVRQKLKDIYKDKYIEPYDFLDI